MSINFPGSPVVKSLYRRLRASLLYEMRFPTYPMKIQKLIRWSVDPVRHAAIALALERIQSENVPGALAEIGVHRGETSRLLHQQIPDRHLYLFDTFNGFPNGDHDTRFRDTSVELVKSKLRDLMNVYFLVGTFPQTAMALKPMQFSFVLFDADKYEVACACLEFFYPRMSRGGYFMFHDFNSTESERAVSRAVTEFLTGKPELITEIPDTWGSAMFRKS